MLKLQYDLYYIKHQSLWLDLVILLKTAIAMLTFNGR
ncbi:MAG: sugar transferase [Candidatus Methylomirabilales bacterium]